MSTRAPSFPKIALVHHWLVTRRGGEQVLEALSGLFPSADLFTLVCDPNELSASLQQHRLHCSFLQRLPRPSLWYRYYLPLFPLATERLDLRGYDLVISSDAATMKGVRVDPKAIHICFCHAPLRCVWSASQSYARAFGPLTRVALRAVRSPLRKWDYRAAQRVTHFVANSEAVRQRIHDLYDRESVVIHPPVDTDAFVIPSSPKQNGDFSLFVSQLVPYKRADLLIEAFNQSGRPLRVIGDGPERQNLRRAARPNIQFLGYQTQQRIIEAMQECRAFVFAGEEDFGIVMAEAQACGKPVIAFAKGGARDIVEDGTTGVLFGEQTVTSILNALERFERLRFDCLTLRASALRFARPRFLEQFSRWLEGVIGRDAGLEAGLEQRVAPASLS